MREQDEARAVAALQPRDEVRALGRLRDEPALHAVPREVALERLGRARLVAGRIDCVEADQLLQERGHLVPEGHPYELSAFDLAVNSLRTSQSSGHGIGSSLDERIVEQTDELMFLYDQLRMDAAQAAK